MDLLDYIELKSSMLLIESIDQDLKTAINAAVERYYGVKNSLKVDYISSLHLYKKLSIYKQLAVDIQDNDSIISLKQHIDQQIEILEQPYLEKMIAFPKAPTEDSWRRRYNNRVGFKNSENALSVVSARIGLHTSFRYPALEVRCGTGLFTKHFVAADPLYLVDRFQACLDETSAQFPTLYQQRLRRYCLTGEPKLDLSSLPKNQFRFIFDWWAATLIPLPNIVDILTDYYELLRPGGIVLIRYNNCDLIDSAKRIKPPLNFSYVPYRLFKPECERLGFEITAKFDIDNVSWVELKKPGELSTCKVHQAMMHTVEI